MICWEGGRAGTRIVWTERVSLACFCLFETEGTRVNVRCGAVQALLLKKEKYKS